MSLLVFRVQELDFCCEFRSEEFVGVNDLDFDLERSLLAVGLRGFFGDVTDVSLVWISFGDDTALLANENFCNIGLIQINFDLQILEVGKGNQCGAGSAGAAETLGCDELIRVDQFLENDTVDG